MWKRIDTPLKRGLILERELHAQASKANMKDSKITIFLLSWALIVTMLFFHQISQTSNGANSKIEDHGSNLNLEVNKGADSLIWHGGSPSDLFKGSCYCGEDAYCMCTPSLAIDAIIEVHHDKFNTGTTELQRVSRRDCFAAVKGRFPGDGVEVTGHYTEGSTAASVRSMASKSLRNEKSSSYRNIKTRNLLNLEDAQPKSNSANGTESAGSSRSMKAIRGGNTLFVGSQPNGYPNGTETFDSLDKSKHSSRHHKKKEKDKSRDREKDRHVVKGRKSKDHVRDKKRGDTDDREGSFANISLVLVFRRDPPSGFAIPGGFVEVGESVEQAVVREVREETNLKLTSLQLFHIYSNPLRDARRHTVSAVYRCTAEDAADLKKGDDAKAVKMVPLKDVLNLPLAFDHKQILSDYIAQYHSYLLD